MKSTRLVLIAAGMLIVHTTAYHAGWDLSGAVQLSGIVQRFGWQLADASGVPTWNADAEFKAVRDKQRK